MPNLRSLALILILLTAIPACQNAAPPPTAPLATSATWIRTDLYFGLTRRDSSTIPEQDFQAFVDHEITPRFPDGLTITPAAGQYLDSHKALHIEPSRILTVLYPASDANTCNAKLNQIAAAYCKQFDQESVLRTDTAAKTQFVTVP